MDLYCKKCGEPWDVYGVNNGDMTSEEAALFKRGVECPCCKGKGVCSSTIPCEECKDSAIGESGYTHCTVNKVKRPLRAEYAQVLADVMPDDLDGQASMLDEIF